MPALQNTRKNPSWHCKSGKGTRKCRVQGNKQGRGGLIRKYGIFMNRQVFRERAADMGWVKYR